jgi:1-deoxy-D-xylulose-5-phosphate reductoisomerase
VLAQLGVTDMRMPIQYALSYPDKWPAAIPGIDFAGGLTSTSRCRTTTASPA